MYTMCMVVHAWQARCSLGLADAEVVPNPTRRPRAARAVAAGAVAGAGAVADVARG